MLDTPFNRTTDGDAYIDNLRTIIRPVANPTYTTDVFWHHIDSYLQETGEDTGGLQLCPDFQRGHVWTESQQLLFIENVIRGLIDQSLLTLKFNCANWNTTNKGDLPDGIVCVDGLQRLTAIQRCMSGEIRPFGYHIDQFNNTPFSCKLKYRFTISIYNFSHKKDLLQFYLDLNAGGTPHSDGELQRVRSMIQGE